MRPNRFGSVDVRSNIVNPGPRLPPLPSTEQGEGENRREKGGRHGRRQMPIAEMKMMQQQQKKKKRNDIMRYRWLEESLLPRTTIQHYRRQRAEMLAGPTAQKRGERWAEMPKQWLRCQQEAKQGLRCPSRG